MASWGYKENDGPKHWHKSFPVANSGSRQSPVDIVTSTCNPEPTMSDLKYQYSPAIINMVNTGASWRMDFNSQEVNLSGGPLDGDYKILQMHAHWGAKAGQGSEHTVDGKMYDAELHIVHYNTKYGDPTAAVDKPDGLAVLGMFIKTGKEHQELSKICKNLESIETKDSSLQMQDSLNPTNCLPENKTFYTYPGSLTTPPLFESVTWIVFKEPIEMSEEQLNTMRSLKIGDGKDCDCMVDNYRPPCPLGQRKIAVK